MNYGILASAQWMAPFGRLLRHFHAATSAEPTGSGIAPALYPVPTPGRATTRPLRVAATRSSVTHASCRAVRSPLRVIRVVEAGQTSASAGRILMSGRMADVCAELDRMVEREAAMQPGV